MPRIYIPTILFWENGNAWYGSDGAARFYVRPAATEEGPRLLEAELWRGPLEKEQSEILAAESFPLSEDGLLALTAWLEAWSARLNG